MNILSYYEAHLKQKLSRAQLETLKILLWLITVHKEVRIERLAAYFPLPIKYESRRRHIQRFLNLSQLSLTIFWFPLITFIIEKQFSQPDQLILVLDRTQWKENNILMVSVVWKKRALPLYWKLLEGNGASNLREQQAVIRPLIKQLKKSQVVIIGDREFHSVELAYWLKNYEKQGVKFAFRQKKSTTIKRGRKYCPLGELEVIPGVKHWLINQKITQKKGFGTYNILWYKKKSKKVEDPWYILTNLSDPEQVVKIYQQRMGIEAMFKDCKTGGYNLEGSRANEQRLTHLILLIAIAYTLSSFKGQKLKNRGIQKYISRTNESQRTERRHSNFWVGIYGATWTLTYDFIEDMVGNLMRINSHKLPFYQAGIRAMKTIQLVLNS